MKKNVVIGFLGTTYDAVGGSTDKRWTRWRPSVSLCAHESSFPVDRLELLICAPSQEALVARIRQDIASISPRTEVVSHLVDLKNPWNIPLVYAALHDFTRSYDFQDDADYYVHWTTGTHQAQMCLFILTESRHFPAKIVDTHLVKDQDEPWRGRVEVIDLNLSAYDQLASRFELEELESVVLLKNGIETKNRQYNATIEEAEDICLRSDEPVLVTGPTGAGKSKLVEMMHQLLTQRHLISGPFIDVNCATLDGQTVLSTLFGHKKGAFTGATEDHKGLLKEADGGVLFLDEIGTLPLDVQAKLLVALEKKEITPMGSNNKVKCNFRLVAGTNLDLRLEVKAGRFRGDLLARIDPWHIQLPGLAERPEDLEPNLDFELDRRSALLKRRVSFNKAAREKYLAFAATAPWPGNFRDLSASVMRMATMAEGGRILEADVDRELRRLRERWGDAPAKRNKSVSLVEVVMPDAELDLFEQAAAEALLRVIQETPTMAEAGRVLFAVSRAKKKSVNDANRVRTHLVKWGLDYRSVKAQLDALGN